MSLPWLRRGKIDKLQDDADIITASMGTYESGQVGKGKLIRFRREGREEKIVSHLWEDRWVYFQNKEKKEGENKKVLR